MVKNNEKKEDIPLFVPFPQDEIRSDTQGSYTGVPEEWMEEPVQDVDDL